MTILSIIQAVADEVGVTRPSAVISSNDGTVRQLLALANREGKSLARLGNWTTLTKEHTFDTVNGTAAYALPSDFDYIVNQTAWDRDNYWMLRGPLSVPLWQAIKSGLYDSTALRKGFRIKGSSSTRFYIDPTPTVVDTIVFEYQSKSWCQSSGGTGQTAWAADTDTGILDEDLMAMGIKWRFLKAKNFDYAEEFREHQNQCLKALGRDGGRPVLDLGERGGRMFDPNIQDADYPTS